MTNNVWVVFPTINAERATKCLQQWKAQGYRSAVLVDEVGAPPEADSVIKVEDYPGYFQSVNKLTQHALLQGADLVVAAADDLYPDGTLTAQEIGREFLDRFPDGCGVMQPIGDDLRGTDQICGSPWFGKGWIEKAYGGDGPLCREYMQFYGDEELKVVTELHGCLWQREDLTHYHEHWMRGGIKRTSYQKANNRKYWRRDQITFKRRQNRNFPGVLP